MPAPLHCEILRMQQGVSYGSGALKALQNDDIPEIDLLVREAIQNSSDAAIDIKDKNSCKIKFNLGSFSSKALNAILPGIGSILDSRYPEGTADFIEIRDSNTTGLTGPVTVEELDPQDHGNYFKLVFDTGKEQTNADEGEAGGSWGYGKSVYYRVGIGLVLFYSRILNANNQYESRLIFSLVENENDTGSLLKQIAPKSVGRAWWGHKSSPTSSEILPITDETEIKEILSLFNIEEFQSSQSGTSIVIPYISKEKLLPEIFPDSCGVDPDEIAMCTFKDSLEEYIKLSIQKWYAPRLNNFKLKELSGQKALDIRVSTPAGTEPLTFKVMRPLFQLVQELYTTAVSANNNPNNIYKSPQFPNIKCIKVTSNSLSPTLAGHVAAIRIPKSVLYPSGAGVSPHTYLRLFGKRAINDPIVMFARTPGLILDYKTNDQWVKGLHAPSDPDTYEFVFFAPKCSSLLKANLPNKHAGEVFEKYLRSREKSDHMDWVDSAKVRIISNLRNNITKNVNLLYADEDTIPVESTASRLGGLIGRRLQLRAPKRTGGGTGTGGSSSKYENLELDLSAPSFAGDNSIDIVFTLKFKNARRKAFIGLFVETSTATSFDPAKWGKQIETPFPLSITKIFNCSVAGEPTGGKEECVSGECTQVSPMIANQFTLIQQTNNEDGATTGFWVDNTAERAIVTGTIRIKTTDIKYSCMLKETHSAAIRGENK